MLLTAADGSFTAVDPTILPLVLAQHAAKQAEEENGADDVAAGVQPTGSAGSASGWAWCHWRKQVPKSGVGPCLLPFFPLPCLSLRSWTP